MERDPFIKLLMSSTPAELNAYIQSKGKNGKPFCPVVFHKKENIEQEENSDGKM